MIELKELVKRFGRRTAVDALTLSVPPGTCYALLGPNGAGKTTTVKMLAGLVRPDRGEVVVGGFGFSDQGDRARSLLGYVPDEPYLYEKLSGREFLSFVGGMHGLEPDGIEREVGVLSERFELSGFLDELAEGYSHGMRQRVVFAASLLHHPKVLVVDEPMVGLDPRSIRLVKDLLRERVREGAAVLMSTHVLEVAEAVADRVGIMSHGRLLVEGSPAEIRSRAGQSGSLEDAFLKLTEEGPRRRAADFPGGRSP